MPFLKLLPKIQLSLILILVYLTTSVTLLLLGYGPLPGWAQETTTNFVPELEAWQRASLDKNSYVSSLQNITDEQVITIEAKITNTTAKPIINLDILASWQYNHSLKTAFLREQEVSPALGKYLANVSVNDQTISWFIPQLPARSEVLLSYSFKSIILPTEGGPWQMTLDLQAASNSPNLTIKARPVNLSFGLAPPPETSSDFVQEDNQNLWQDVSQGIEEGLQETGQALNQIRQNTVVQATTTVAVTPTTVVATTATSFSLINHLGLSFKDLPALMGHFFTLFLELIGARPKKRRWGQVLESLSQKPIPYARIANIDAANGNIQEIVLSGLDGLYRFNTTQGSIKLLANKKGYQFPSLIDETAYQGQVIQITKERLPFTKLIMDAQEKTDLQTDLWQARLRKLNSLIDRFFNTIRLIGLFLSFWLVFIFPHLFSLGLFFLNCLLFLISWRLNIKTPNS